MSGSAFRSSGEGAGAGAQRRGQLLLDLDLPRRPAMGRLDFLVAPCNADAVALVEGWRSWPSRRLAVCGPAGTGKTHLAHVWMVDAGAQRIAAAALTEVGAPDFAATGAVAVEDVDRLTNLPPDHRRAAERALFHLYNLLNADGGWLLLTGRGAPSRWRIETPDLASRLQSVAAAVLEEPDDPLLGALLVKLFADRQLAVGPRLIGYLLRRMDRSFAGAETVVARLDEASLLARRTLTPRFAAETLGW